MRKLQHFLKTSNPQRREISILHSLARSNLIPKILEVIDEAIREYSRRAERIEAADKSSLSVCQEETLWTKHADLMGVVRDLKFIRFHFLLRAAQANEIKHILSRKTKR